MACANFFPGPASSQVGFTIGFIRAGYFGGLAAWIGFTLPSATVLVLYAYGADAVSGPIGPGLVHGLKLVAVAIVRASGIEDGAHTEPRSGAGAIALRLPCVKFMVGHSSHRPGRSNYVWRLGWALALPPRPHPR